MGIVWLSLCTSCTTKMDFHADLNPNGNCNLENVLVFANSFQQWKCGNLSGSETIADLLNPADFVFVTFCDKYNREAYNSCGFHHF